MTGCSLDVFQFCAGTLRILGKVMILLVLAIVAVSYYAMWTCYAPLLSSRSPARVLLGFASLGTFTALVRGHAIHGVLVFIPIYLVGNRKLSPERNIQYLAPVLD